LEARSVQVLVYVRDLKITGGNAEVVESMGITKKAIHKLMKRKRLEIDGGTKGRFVDLKVGITA
jgi:hypothetical protein